MYSKEEAGLVEEAAAVKQCCHKSACVNMTGCYLSADFLPKPYYSLCAEIVLKREVLLFVSWPAVAPFFIFPVEQLFTVHWLFCFFCVIDGV